MKKKIILIVSIIILGFFISLNTRAQDVNLDTLVETNNYNSNATKLIITSDKNLNKINMLNMPNLVQVNISNVNIPNSSVIHLKNKIKLLYLKNVVINTDGIYDTNIEKIEIRNSYIYGNSSKKYEEIAKYNAKYMENTTYNSEINKIAQSIYKNGMSKEDIIRKVTLYVTNHLTYNLAMAGSEKNYAINSLNGQGVCGEYAYLESQLLNKLGIYTLTIYGYPTDRSTYHAWNVVYLNNNWYTIDPTWLDTKGNSNTYDSSSERYKKYYLRPISANIYKPDFSLYNSIPTSERIAKSIVQTTNTNTNTNKNTTTTTNSNTNNNTTNNKTINSNNSTSSNQSTNPNEKNTTSNNSTSNQNTNSNDKNTTSSDNTSSNQSTSSNDKNTTSNNNITANQNTTINNNNTSNDNTTSNQDSSLNEKNTITNEEKEIISNNQNVTNNETNINNKIENNYLNIPDEVEVPDTKSNNILFIIIGFLTIFLGINFIKKQKEN